MWRETTERLDAACCPYRVLPRWYDVDDEDDLACLTSDLVVEKDDQSLAPLRRAVAVALGVGGASDS